MAAERLLLDGTVKVIVRIHPDFARRVALGSAEIQVILHGADSNSARISLGYARGAITSWCPA
jgi:ABC-2 type transport system permease protein